MKNKADGAKQLTMIDSAVQLLRSGGVVGFPTETVYGLGADASKADAVQRIFSIKGRPSSHPLIVHIASAEHLDEWARDIPPVARSLAETFWPGPLTLVLRRQPWVLDAITGGQDTVALRVPAHPVAQALLASGMALAAPSANRFGRLSPTTADHVREELNDSVDIILDGGSCLHGLESTIVTVIDSKPVLLRPGAISVADIEKVLGMQMETGTPPVKLRAPGMLERHYAPATPVELVPAENLELRATQLTEQGLTVAVLARGIVTREFPCARLEEMPRYPAAYGRKLYAALRKLDAAKFDVLLIEMPPDGNEWLAVRDRLVRAARTRTNFPE